MFLTMLLFPRTLAYPFANVTMGTINILNIEMRYEFFFFAAGPFTSISEEKA